MSGVEVAERPEAPPKVDPRMRDRWIRARRQEGHRRLRLLVVLAAVVAVGAGAFGVTRTPLLAVETVQVNGAQHETAAQIIEASGLGSHPAMLGLNTAAVVRRIDAVPWVASARVSLRWPKTVRVAVVERSAVAVVAQSVTGPGAVAAVAAGAPTVLVDNTGRVLTTGNGLVPGLPIIVMPSIPRPPGQWLAGATPGAITPGGGTPMDALLELAADLPPKLAPSVVYLDLGADGSLQGAISVPVSTTTSTSKATYPTSANPTASGQKTDGSATDVQVPVTFGDGSDLPAKIISLQTVMAQIDLSHVVGIDVSDSQDPYLRGDPQPAIVSPTAGG